MDRAHSIGSAPRTQSNHPNDRPDELYVKVLTCNHDRQPKTGTEYSGLLHTGRGSPTPFVSEIRLTEGARFYVETARWSSVEDHGTVLKLTQPQEVGAPDG